MPIDLQNVSTEQLKRALELREQIDALKSELNQIIEGKAPPARAAATDKKAGGKRELSPEARQKMAEAARKRWAAKRKLNGAPVKADAEPQATGKRTMSPEGKARIAAAAKKRWAAKRKADKAAMAGATAAAPAKEEKPAEKPAAKKKANPKVLAALARARAAKAAKAAA